jgi:hypothetical protein
MRRRRVTMHKQSLMLSVSDIKEGGKWYLKVYDFMPLVDLQLPFTIELKGKHNKEEYVIDVHTLSWKYLIATGTVTKKQRGGNKYDK